MRSYRHWLLALLLFGLAAVALVAAAPPAQAQTVAPAGLPPGAIPPAQAGDDTACRLCHQDTDGEFTLPSGETRSARVDMDSLAHSAHGAADLACTDCHDGNRFGQPHEEPTAADFRAFELENNASCVRCHGAPHITSHEATAENPEPNAVCTDCHGSHDVATVADWPAADQADRCIDCHDASDEVRLLVISSAGLFTDTVDENYCLSCHREDGPGLMLGDDESVSTQFDESAFRSSVHGEDNEWGEISCRHCHENATPYPHPAVEAADHRDYSLAMSENCAACHDHNFELAQDSVHADALADGDRDAAVCTDCHGFHNVVPAAEPRSNVSQICRQCHSTIYDEYATSVHGDSLLNDENQDVPTCIECHGVHNIGDPTTNLFRIRSPQLCAECHANEL
ncbi:MAG: cytochrome c3 family protein, partial [Anaerolineales bacterium]|nr:cytochrome c3 family protein [Anaerolineales bacterium]